MAYWIQYRGTCENSIRNGYVCETISDISKLPTQNKDGKKQEFDSVSHKCCSYGSEAYVIEDGSRYMLMRTSDTWEKLVPVLTNSGETIEVVGDGGIFLTIEDENTSDENTLFLTQP